MKVGYVIARFPKISESFVASEIAAVKELGLEVEIYSLVRTPGSRPRHPEAAALEKETTFFGTSRLAMARASLSALSRRNGWIALWRAVQMALAARRFFFIRLFGPAANLARISPGDIEHLHAHFAYAPTAIACLAATILGIPFSFTAHAHDFQRTRAAGDLRVYGKYATSIVVVSRSARIELAAKLLPKDRTKIQVIRNGVDLQALDVARAEEPNLVVCVARLVECKGIDTLLRATEISKHKGIDIRVELIGVGEEEGELRALAKKLGIGDAVVFLGSQNAVAVRQLLGRACVFALPAREAADGSKDTLPVAITEAMGAGVPVVSTPIAGIPEIIENESTGLLVTPDDPRALAGAIERLLADDELRDRLARAGRVMVEKNYDRRETARAITELWQNV
jgi:glycosyltransferase involved in cell wall biosynthesis